MSAVGNTPITLIYLLVGALVILLGIIILREAPRERANRATALMLFSGGVGSVLGAVGFVLNSMGPQQGGRERPAPLVQLSLGILLPLAPLLRVRLSDAESLLQAHPFGLALDLRAARLPPDA